MSSLIPDWVDLVGYALSCMTLIVIWLAGNQSKWAWIIGFLIQFVWIYFGFLVGSTGLIPLSVALMFVYGRNLRKSIRSVPAKPAQVSSGDYHSTLILRNLIRQHDRSGGWSTDCGCTWHSMARANIERILGVENV